MAASSAGPKVSAVVDEENGTVSVGVEHDGQYLPVATASLDYAKARNLSKKGESLDEPAEEGGEG